MIILGSDIRIMEYWLEAGLNFVIIWRKNWLSNWKNCLNLICIFFSIERRVYSVKSLNNEKSRFLFYLVKLVNF